MEDSPNRQADASTQMAREFHRAREQLRDLGLTLSVWDHFGEQIDGFAPLSCEPCELIGRCGSACDDVRNVAQHVVFTDRPIKSRSSLGGCIIGVPVHDRRRLVAAAVACYPVKEILEGEQLHRLCDRLQLDYKFVSEQIAPLCRYTLDDTERLIDLLVKVFGREHALRVAEEELVGLSENLSRTYEELSFVYRISGTMKLTNEPHAFLREDVCEELLEVMNVQYAAAIVYPHPPGSGETEIVSAGDLDVDAEQVKRLVADEIVPQFSDEVRSIVENHFVGGSRNNLPDEIDRLIAVPLVGDGEPIGVLLVINKIDDEFNSIDLKLLGAIGNQAVVFLKNHRLYADMQDLLMGVLESLTASIDAKDPYTCGHSLRVARISERLAQEMGYPPDRVRQIYLAGLLHDVGKIGVPESVLCKPGRLTEQEYAHIKRHPAVAARILGGIRQLDDVAVAILTHHERLDGRGYPQGLGGEELPMEGRILGLADCFDAMSSDRCYRDALPLSVVVEEIRAHAGTQFDADLVEKLLAMDLEAFLNEMRSDESECQLRPDGQER